MTDPADLKRPMIRSALWLALWTLATVWVCNVLATSWPYMNLPPQILLLFAVPGMVFRLVDLGIMKFAARRLAGWRRWVARLASLAGGFVIMGLLWSAMDNLSMARFERALAPLAAQIHANAAAPCPPEARYVIGPGLVEYLDESRAPGRPATLRHDKQRFVLWVMGGSIDIDGSTVFYDSTIRKWTKFHNDNREARAVFEELVKPLAECRIALR